MFKSTVACFIACLSATSSAQTISQTYALRQELRNDAYLWEPLLAESRPSPPNPQHASNSRSDAPITAATLAAPAALPPAASGVLNYYGSLQAAATLQQMPQRRFISSGKAPNRAQTRPFSRITSRPTVSPYLNLFREEDDESAPNYFAFVRPQQRQIETNERHQREMERLERRLRSAESVTPSAVGSGGLPTTGRTAARFGDTGQFYGRRR